LRQYSTGLKTNTINECVRIDSFIFITSQLSCEVNFSSMPFVISSVLIVNTL